MTVNILAEVETEILGLADDVEDDEFADGYGVAVRLRDLARKIAVEVERLKRAEP